jgi:hypothetical protein
MFVTLFSRTSTLSPAGLSNCDVVIGLYSVTACPRLSSALHNSGCLDLRRHYPWLFTKASLSFVFRLLRSLTPSLSQSGGFSLFLWKKRDAHSPTPPHSSSH